ncbi:MAG: Crp/Fnr family transcriptional regulator [Myxococcota bacterium]
MPTSAPGAAAPEMGRTELGAYERSLLLGSLPTISALPPEAVDVFARHARTRTYPRGAVVQEPGRPPDALRIVAEGQVEVSERGRPVVTVRPGHGVGVLALLAGTSEGRRAVATTRVLALEIPAEVFFELLEEHFPLLQGFLRTGAGAALDELSKLYTERIIPGRMTVPDLPCPACDLDLVERLLFLRRMPVFRGASVDSLAGWARRLTEIRVPAGETLWRRGDRADRVLFVVCGEIRAVTPEEDRAMRYRAYSAAGVLTALAERPRWGTATTLSPLVALESDAAGMMDVFEDDTELGMALVRALHREILDLQRQSAGLP